MVTNTVEKYPRRLKRLQRKIDDLNGKELTEEEGWGIVKALAESQFDLWDIVITLKSDVDKKEDWGQIAVRWFVRGVLPRLLETAIVALVAWWLIVQNYISIQ